MAGLSSSTVALTFATRTVLAPNLRKKYGDWSVVSGATDGIGKAYCHELARQKINLAVMGRTKAKVDEPVSYTHLTLPTKA